MNLALSLMFLLAKEIRLLKWRDFSDDLSYINLTGDKVKSKRNRIVPVPKYIRKILKKGDNHNNIFSNNKQPYNKSYFSLIWRRFKRRYPTIEATKQSTHLGTQEL
jgi:integrase